MTAITMDQIRSPIEELIREAQHTRLTREHIEKAIDKHLYSKFADKIRSQEYVNLSQQDDILSMSLSIFDTQTSICHAAGYQDPLNTDNQVTSNTLYNLASISKFILTIMTIRLIQMGHLSLENHVNHFLLDSGIPNANKITIADLLSHRSGLKDCGFIHLPEEAPLSRLLKNTDANIPDLAGQPGETFYYANINFVIIAKIIQVVTSKTLQEAFQHLIGDPLKLPNVFVIGQFDFTNHDVAQGYSPNFGLTQLTSISNNNMFGATGFRSTPQEISKLMYHFFKNDEFIYPNMRALLLDTIHDEIFEVATPTDIYRWPIKIGMGLEEREFVLDSKKIKLFCHGGWQDGNAAFVAFVPDLEMTFCCCVTKTQGLYRINQYKKEVSQFGSNKIPSTEKTPDSQLNRRLT